MNEKDALKLVGILPKLRKLNIINKLLERSKDKHDFSLRVSHANIQWHFVGRGSKVHDAFDFFRGAC